VNGGAKKKRVVLVVDDDGVTRTLIKAALGTAYEVHAAADAVEAEALLDKMPTPDLVVCDVMMPKVDGFRFVQSMKVRAGFEKIPVMFLTAKTHPLDVVRGINAGARHYVTKPFKIEELVAKVAKILG
jgi:DNA-binding response OmpR family regulator